MRSYFSKLGVPALMALVAAVTLTPAPARACSYLLVNIEAAFPANGAVDVPTNGVLFLYGSLGIDARYFTLADEAGTEVSIEVSQAEPRGVIIRPLSELEPLTRYELRLGEETDRPSPIDRLEFTTGAGPKARSETLPAPTVSMREFAYSYHSCGMIHGLCVDGAAPEGYVLQLDFDGDVRFVNGDPDFPVHRSANRDFPDDGCIDVRYRGVLGDLSAATRLCGAQVERVMVPPPDYDEVYSCNDVDAVLQATSSNDAGAPQALPSDGGVSVASSDLPASDLARSAAPEAAAGSGGCSITSPTSATRRGGLGWSVLGLALVARSASRARRALFRRD